MFPTDTYFIGKIDINNPTFYSSDVNNPTFGLFSYNPVEIPNILNNVF